MPAVRTGIHPTQRQEQIILGCLLGDGTLTKPTNGLNYHFSVSHADSQRGYFNWMADELRSLVSSIATYTRFDHRCGKFQTTIRLNTITCPYFSRLRDLTYPAGTKAVTENWLGQMVDPLAISVWIMDDGGACGRIASNISIATCAFSPSEVDSLVNWLQERWGVSCARTGTSAHPRINIRVGGVDKLRKLVLSEIPE